LGISDTARHLPY